MTLQEERSGAEGAPPPPPSPAPFNNNSLPPPSNVAAAHAHLSSRAASHVAMFKDVQKLVLNDDDDYGEDAYEEFIEEDLGSGSSTPIERFLSEHSSKVASRQPSRDYNRAPQRHSAELRPATGSSDFSSRSSSGLTDITPHTHLGQPFQPIIQKLLTPFNRNPIIWKVCPFPQICVWPVSADMWTF